MLPCLKWKSGVIFREVSTDYSRVGVFQTMIAKQKMESRSEKEVSSASIRKQKCSRTNQKVFLTLFVYEGLCLVLLFKRLHFVFLAQMHQ